VVLTMAPEGPEGQYCDTQVALILCTFATPSEYEPARGAVRLCS
jgi:hypothetical protein